MKNYYKIVPLLLLTCNLFGNEVNATKGNIAQIGDIQTQEVNIPDKQAYDEMFESISVPRRGLNENNISKLKDPFVIQKPFKPQNDTNGSSSEGELRLHAIFNDRVKINSKWYKLGEQIGDYKLQKIKISSVILRSKDQNLELNLTKGSNNVSIKIK